MMEQKNLILAIVLSAVVLFGSQFLLNHFYPPAQPVTTASTTATGTPSAPGTTAQPATPPAPAFKPREVALAESQRVKISTDALLGSIALTGGRLDDLTLARYHETVQRNSPLVILLNPPGTSDAYYADFGWLADSGSDIKLPDGNTHWTADDATLTSE